MQELRETLVNLIEMLRDNPEENIRNPDKDFKRNRKLPFDKLHTSNGRRIFE